MVTFIQPFLVFVQRRIKDKERKRAKRGELRRKQGLSKVVCTLRCPHKGLFDTPEPQTAAAGGPPSKVGRIPERGNKSLDQPGQRL